MAAKPQAPPQLAMVGGRIKKLFADEAKKRQKAHGGTAPGKKKTLPENLREVKPDRKANEASSQAGAAVGVSGKSIDHAAAIIHNQFGRRNLADIDRISLARRREEILRPKAAENLKGFKGNQHTGPLPKLAKDQKKIDTRQESAKAAGVGKHTYDAGKLILDAVENERARQEPIQQA